MSSVKSLIAFTAGLVVGAAAVTMVLTDKGDKLIAKAKKCLNSLENDIEDEEDYIEEPQNED